MPSLDVSEVLSDSDIASKFIVRRHRETVGNNGRATVQTKSIRNVVGVITVSSPSDLKRLTEEDRTGKHLSIVTKFKMRATAPGYKPDTILWYGSEYQVKNIEPYPQYGAGFVQVIVGSIEAQDQPPRDNPPATGRMTFTEARRSSLALILVNDQKPVDNAINTF